jgi:predicted phage baseplate assembly protein
VETESDATAYLRFSEQNRERWAGQISEGMFKGFTAKYRVGNGSRGNVGAESIRRITASAPAGVTKVFNPMPARGGEDADTIESIQLHAPQAFRKQERAVTAADYEEILTRHSEVQKAAAEKRWTGSWCTMFVAIDRKGGLEVDSEFEAEIVGFLEKYRMAGYDVEVQSPIYVPLKISIEVCLKDGYFRGEIKEELHNAFGSKLREDGSKGFFHPDNFTFGQTLYLSRLYEAALAVAGVSSVVVTEFHRWGKEPRRELDNGYIDAGPMEILRLDNDPNFAEYGVIEFSFCGGA